MSRITPTGKLRLQQLMRPNYYAAPEGNPTQTDRALADKGLVIFRGVHGRPGYFITALTEAGRNAVEPDEYEYCGCGARTPRQEAACVSCGSTKDWANTPAEFGNIGADGVQS